MKSLFAKTDNPVFLFFMFKNHVFYYVIILLLCFIELGI